MPQNEPKSQVFDFQLAFKVLQTSFHTYRPFSPSKSNEFWDDDGLPKIPTHEIFNPPKGSKIKNLSLGSNIKN